VLIPADRAWVTIDEQRTRLIAVVATLTQDLSGIGEQSAD
jgi:hypothetical protein